MNLEELWGTARTVSQSRSEKMFIEVCSQSNWRAYASDEHDEVETWAERFLQHHARIPGVFSDSMAPLRPVEVFSFEGEDGLSLKGGLFLNGAVVRLRQELGQEPILLLFVDEETATTWNYPPGLQRTILGPGGER